MRSLTKKKHAIFLLLLSAFVCVCLGRGYQCIFWDIPIRSLLWHEDLIGPLVSTFFDLSWESYLLHPQSDSSIQTIVSFIGFSLLAFSAVVIMRRHSMITSLSLYLAFALLLFIAFLYHLEKFQTTGQFFEYTLQFMTPLILLWYLRHGVSSRWVLLLKIVTAFTFVSHGLYALGFYPVPGLFVSMTIQILKCSDTAAVNFLLGIGVLDLVFSVGLFFKGRVFRISVFYCITWGALTALARLLAHVDFSMLGSTLHQWWFEAIYRAPHFLIPYVLWIVVDKKRVLEKHK